MQTTFIKGLHKCIYFLKTYIIKWSEIILYKNLKDNKDFVTSNSNKGYFKGIDWKYSMSWQM